MDFGFHSSFAKCIYMYMSAQENIKRSRQLTVDNLSRSVGDLDSNGDKLAYLDHFASVFSVQQHRAKFHFEPYKGDSDAAALSVSAEQSPLIHAEMAQRYEQLDTRLATIKAENDEIFKTIEATEHSLLAFFDVKNSDVSDLFRDLNLTSQSSAALNKTKRLEVEDFYVEKVRQFTTSSNLIARLEARHALMSKALSSTTAAAAATVPPTPSPAVVELHNESNSNSNSNNKCVDMSSSVRLKKKIGKSPMIGQPRLFGGKLVEYIVASKHDIPPIITSCVRAINRLGLHNQGIFRIPGSQLEINQFKEAFEKCDDLDPLVAVSPREMNSVAGVLKLYLRELREPLFPRDLYDSFINAMRVTSLEQQQQQQQQPPKQQQQEQENGSLDWSSSPSASPSPSHHQHQHQQPHFSLSPVENIEAMKVERIRRVMEQVPRPVYVVLRYLFAFLNHLSEFKDENMMDSYNIAICLAPTLMPVPDDKQTVNQQTDTIELIKLIIQHNEQIFSMECDGAPLYEKFDRYTYIYDIYMFTVFE